MAKIQNNRLPVGFRTSYLGTFCRYWCVPCVYQSLYMYVKHSSRGTALKFYRWRYRAILSHPLLKPISDVKFHHFGQCAKFHEFSSMFRPSKMRFILEKKKKNHRCSSPNKNSLPFFSKLYTQIQELHTQNSKYLTSLAK